MIYKPLNDFMIESSLKNMAWDGIFINWLNKNYPEIVLKNDSNIWQCLGNNDDIISTYKQIKLFLHDEIAGEENLTRLKNLICINCFGINLETTDYLIEEMSKYLDCLSIPEKNMYDTLRMISNTSIYDILISYMKNLKTLLFLLFLVLEKLWTQIIRDLWLIVLNFQKLSLINQQLELL